eukprot:TRINITY_DN6766_c0_g2_i1.p1 TRINITY_DN6766_c0_g2~~TRINITY_DN6766_c0_g2_i1.p1  ORF type:complete len:835 (+),score=182.42 TRINITY_DN6766_c0_g2_i1:53-2557(+)
MGWISVRLCALPPFGTGLFCCCHSRDSAYVTGACARSVSNSCDVFVTGWESLVSSNLSTCVGGRWIFYFYFLENHIGATTPPSSYSFYTNDSKATVSVLYWRGGVEEEGAKTQGTPLLGGVDLEMSGEKWEPSTRCKLYKLSQGDWVPVGVGYASVEVKEEGESRLLLADEDDPRNLLVSHAIEQGLPHNYQKQQDTLILFTNPATQEEFGLSFEKADGCRVIWSQIMSMLKDSDIPMEETPLVLPRVAKDTISQLADTLESIVTDPTKTYHVRDVIAGALIAEEYVPKLFDLFAEAENASPIDVHTLHAVFRIARCFLLLNSTEMMKELLSFHNIRKLIGCFEYIPARPGKKIEHRKLLDSIRFRNPLEVSEGLAEKIQQIYMVQYLKETVVASVLDDSAYDSLNMYLLVNRNDVLRTIACDDEHMNSLFSALLSTETSVEGKEGLILFLQDMVSSSKSLPPQHKLDFFDYLRRCGIFTVLATTIPSPSLKTRTAAADILWQISNLDVNHIRDHSLQPPEKEKGCPLLRVLFSQLILEDVEGLQQQWQDIIRLIMETQTQKYQLAIANGPSPPDMPPGFIALLYEPLPPNAPAANQHPPLIQKFFDPIRYHPHNVAAEEVPAGYEMLKDVKRCNAILYCVLPIISTCVIGHSARMNTFLLTESVPRKVVGLLELPLERHLVLAIVWFVKALIVSGDEMVARHLVQHKLLAPLMKMLQSSPRYDLLNSALLSVLEYVWRENCRTVLKHLVTDHADTLNSITYAEVGRFVKETHARNTEYTTTEINTPTAKRPASVAGPFHSRLEDTDDSYFDGDDDMESEDSSSSKKRKIEASS